MSAGRSYRRRMRQAWLYVGPEIPEDASQTLKNALALRNSANIAGTCPECGATMALAGEPSPGVRSFVMEHEPGCPVLLTVGEP
jgi:hypothetical protein